MCLAEQAYNQHNTVRFSLGLDLWFSLLFLGNVLTVLELESFMCKMFNKTVIQLLPAWHTNMKNLWHLPFKKVSKYVAGISAVLIFF